MPLEVLRSLGYRPKASTYKVKMNRQKLKFFSQLTLLSNNSVLTSYLSGIYIKSWLSWLWDGVQKTSKKRRKQKKTLKSEEKEKRRIRGKSNNSNIHLWF